MKTKKSTRVKFLIKPALIILMMFSGFYSLKAQVLLDAHSSAGGATTWTLTTTQPNEIILIAADCYGTLSTTAGTVTVNGNNATYENEGLYSNGDSWTASIWAYQATTVGTYTLVCTESGADAPFYFNYAASVYEPSTTLTLANIVIGGNANNQTNTATASITTTIANSYIYGSSCFNDNGGSGTITWNGSLTELDHLYISDGVDADQAGITEAVAGTYVITVTDNGADNPWATEALIAVQPSNNSCTLTTTAFVNSNALCYGAADGSASANPSAGTLPYTYLWNDASSQTNVTATGLSAGNYTVTVTDNTGCTATASVTITQPGQIQICGGGPPTTVTFSYTGSPQTWTVPAGVSSVTLDVQGAQGGSGGGLGGRVQCTYATSPATLFNIYVGGQGGAEASSAPGGWNGGGNAGICSGYYLGSGGGGESDIRVGGTAFANWVVVAGGGGGTQQINGNPGAGGGLTGGNVGSTGNGCISTYATGGSQVAGGLNCTTSGSCCTFGVTANGTMGFGANGDGPSVSCNNGDGGGGGGGGYYGGGCGGGYSSGGGGSSWTSGACTNVIHTQGYTSGNGMIVISYSTPGGITTTNASCANNDGSVTISCVTGGTGAYTYSWSPGGATTAAVSGLSAGTYTVTITDANGCSSTASATISQSSTITICGGGPPTTVNFSYTGSLQTWTVPAGATQATVTAFGAAGGVGTATSNNGLGAEIEGSFTVNPGDIIDVMVGGQGLANNEGSGGGGSFVWNTTGNVLMVAAGGGGGSYQGGGGGNGSATTAPTLGTGPQGSSPGGAGGNGGTGGTCSSVYAGGGAGAGWLSAGGVGSSCGGYGGGNGGNTPLTGGAGGISNVLNGCTYSSNGAYGGGGASTCYGAGGGGGYNGGGGAIGFVAGGNGGGGGGSYDGGTAILATAGVQTTDGMVSITYATPGGITVTNASCANNDGSVNVACVSGGTAPYTYSWSPGGATTASVSGLSAATYSVTITDANGCSTTASATIIISSQIQICGPAPTTVNFSYTGSSQSFTVPPGVTTITTTLYGAQGGLASLCSTYYSPTPATGGAVTGTLAVVPGTTYEIFVGGGGQIGLTSGPAAGGYNGGGAGAFYNGNYGGGGGGGETDIRSTPYAFANVIAVAGGGGGEAYNYGCGTESGGRGGAATGEAGYEDYSNTAYTYPGGGGSQIAGGIGGVYVGYCDGTAGTQGQGGAGGTCTNDGGGGGGGYWGGGGGVWGGGGGGSDYTGGLTTVISDVQGGGATSLSPLIAGADGSASIMYSTPGGITITNVTCFNGSDGSLNISCVSGGTAPYTYSWSPGGATTSSVSGLSATTYTVTINDANGCSLTASATITQPTQILPNVTVTSNSSACGNTGSASSSPTGGTSPYTYSWSNSATTSSISALSAGTYSLTVTDSIGCSNTASVTITAPANLVANASVTSNSSACGNTGIASSSPTGGNSPYTYSWSNAATTSSISALSAGTYTLMVTDNDGCTATDQVTITAPANLVANASITSNSTACTSSGSAMSNPTGGNSPYTYSWSNAATTSSISALSAGTYTLTVTDNDGCTATDQVTITAPANLVANASVTSNTTACGSSGGAVSNPTGGNSPYTYSWSNSGTTSSISALSAGTYTLTVTDNDGCTATDQVTITAPANVVANASVTSNTTACGSTGSAMSNPTGGTSPYTYLWSNSATTSSISALSAGTYTLTVTDNSGCTATDSVTITAPANVVANASVTSNASACASTGSALSSPTGGTSPYTYLWSNSATTSSISALSAGTYTLMVTDNSGCTATDAVTITAPANVAANASVTSNASACASSGSAMSNPTGGSSPYTYLWSNSATTSSISALSAGTYTLMVTDNSGCTGTASVTITAPANVAANATVTSNTTACASTGSALSSPTGGTSPYTYLWSNSATTSSISALSAGTYTLTVTDNSGCTGTGSVTITAPASVTALAAVNANTTECSSVGSATVTASGGTSPYTYLWTGGKTTASISGLSAGNYTVTVTDNTGCTATASVTITAPAAMAATGNVVANSSECGNMGAASVTSTGGTSPYTYLWTGGKTSASISGLSAGTYTVTVTDGNGCNTTASVTITAPAALSLAQGFVPNTSPIGICNGKAWVTVSGGSAAYTYLWSPGSQTTDTITGQCAGTYCVKVTDANGCIDSTCIVLTATQTIFNNASSIKIYPDPNMGNFTVDGLIRGQIVVVYDYLGQQITSVVTDKESIQFNIADKANGVYLIRIENSDGSTVTNRKIVKTQ